MPRKSVTVAASLLLWLHCFCGASAAAEVGAGETDLWQRLRQGFALEEAQRTEVDAYTRWYARHPRYLQRVAGRARPFLRMILEEVERRDLPAELALLPVVESAFDAYAYSHGQASGIWQFIPATARHYGLKLNWWYDGRRDVIAATEAALDYLQSLHRGFDGDWLLALAAYNAGQGNVRKAQRKNRRAGRPADFWHLDLPRETEGYPPKLLALRRIIADPERYGVQLPPMPDTKQVEAVDAGDQIDLAQVAGLARIELELLYRLNPGLNRWATPPDGPHRLLVPVEHAERLRAALAELPAEQRLRWQRYRIQPGDVLSRIAKRHGVTADLLRKVNELPDHRIVAGRHLLIPQSSRPLAEYVLSAEQRRARRLHSGRGEAPKRLHTVRDGDTLWALARAYRVSVRRLAAWNGMSPKDVLRPGRRLVVGKSKIRTPVHDMVKAVYYTVRRGDSLSRIASRFRVRVRQISDWNELDTGAYLQPGQKLKLYVDVRRQSAG